jgi:nitrogen-specific signal transduction histidine kinase
MAYAIERQAMLTALDMQQKQQLQIKDQFLSHVSHELRTPLTSIHQFVMILLDGLAGPLSDEQRDHLETVLRGTNQLRAMIADLLEATRAESGKIRLERRCLAIDEVILQVVAMLQSTAHEKGIALKVDIEGRVPLVYADSDRVIQVLINLTQNAIKFTPRGGSATVRARIVEADPDVVYISVADTGVGVSSEARLHIFERLYQEPNTIQESRKGLGLGLYIAKELVRLHGGRIWLESQKEQGSVFSFTLPLFSLAKLLAPIISVHDRLRESVSLLTIEVTPLLGITDRNWRDIRDECEELLGLCILPDKDLLMPVLATTGPAESFLIVASTNLLGAHVILERIRTQLERRPEFQAAASFKFFATSIPLPVTQEQDLNTLVQQVADTITKVATTNLRLKVIFDSLDAQVDIRDRKENSDGQIQDLDR